MVGKKDLYPQEPGNAIEKVGPWIDMYNEGLWRDKASSIVKSRAQRPEWAILRVRSQSHHKEIG